MGRLGAFFNVKSKILNSKSKNIKTELFPSIISYIFAHSEKSEVNLAFKFYI